MAKLDEDGEAIGAMVVVEDGVIKVEANGVGAGVRIVAPLARPQWEGGGAAGAALVEAEQRPVGRGVSS